MYNSALYFLFFFQAEDGIRDRNVTGVQTCALPICDWLTTNCPGQRDNCVKRLQRPAMAVGPCRPLTRSEERRVGKECSSRGSAVGGKESEGRRWAVVVVCACGVVVL